VPELNVDYVTIRRAILESGVSCGQLTPVVNAGKRLVLTDGSLVARVALPGDHTRNTPSEEVLWARSIAGVVPAQRPVAEPLLHGSLAVTLWEWLNGSELTIRDAHAHGATLRKLHDYATPPDSPHVYVDQLDKARSRINSVGDDSLRRILISMLELAATVLERSDAGAIVVSHGDAHDRNTLMVDNTVHLLDFDSSCLAQRHIDVASGVYAWRLNHRDEAAVREFLSGYGAHSDLDCVSMEDLMWVRRFRATCTRAAAKQDVTCRLRELIDTSPKI
jgi:Ser/Thr protein kinase RdoA (MazF antagonist)